MIHFNVQILEKLVLVTVAAAIFSPGRLTHNKLWNIGVLIYINSLSKSLPTVSATVHLSLGVSRAPFSTYIPTTDASVFSSCDDTRSQTGSACNGRKVIGNGCSWLDCRLLFNVHRLILAGCKFQCSSASLTLRRRKTVSHGDLLIEALLNEFLGLGRQPVFGCVEHGARLGHIYAAVHAVLPQGFVKMAHRYIFLAIVADEPAEILDHVGVSTCAITVVSQGRWLLSNNRNASNHTA